ncbi:MAG: GNAT family N-acetyltransferase [Nocardioides sp.]|nr:GNAT family N-acetyltransferase [Nocardioides sp.]
MNDQSHPHLTFRTLHARDGDAESEQHTTAWIQAVSRGFHDGRIEDDGLRFWRHHAAVDGAVATGVWDDRPTPGRPDDAGPELPVATFVSFDKDLSVGGGSRVPVHMITDVTVAPTHRRNGLLRRMMGDALAAAAARGLPLAALTVSEGGIYGRFGFGPATRHRTVEVDVRSGFAFRRPVADAGRVVLVEPAHLLTTAQEVFARFHSATRGSIGRPSVYDAFTDASMAPDLTGPNKALRAAVHLDADGRPDGYALHKHSYADDRGKLEVFELLAVDDTAYLALWEHLAAMDLVDVVTWNRSPVDDPLAWALVSPRSVKVTGVRDGLWVRVLDVVAALQGRPWAADGSVVLAVSDPLGHAEGRFRVEVASGTATASALDGPSSPDDVALAVDTLGSLYLGDVDVEVLAAAGRVTGPSDAVGTFAAMARCGTAPYNPTGF